MSLDPVRWEKVPVRILAAVGTSNVLFGKPKYDSASGRTTCFVDDDVRDPGLPWTVASGCLRVAVGGGDLLDTDGARS